MSVMVDLLACQWGQQLLSDYHVVKCVHISPMSEVYALESEDGRQRLILKAMNPAIISIQMLETLKITALTGIVPILDYHITEQFAYVVKPYIDGTTLQDYVTRGLSIKTLLSLMIQLVRLVSSCHSQSPPIILRDIKPDNLILCDNQLYLFDMESSKLKLSTTASRDTVLLGTPGYAAPEQYGFQNSDERTDVYAIGQVMNSLLERVLATKSHGFFSIFFESLMLRSAQRIARRATSFDPARRFQSTQTFEKALEQINPRTYMSFLTASVVVTALVFVGFQLPTIKTPAPTPTAIINAVPVDKLSQSTTLATEPTTVLATELPTDAIIDLTTEPTTEAITDAITDATTLPNQMSTAQTTLARPPQQTTSPSTQKVIAKTITTVAPQTATIAPPIEISKGDVATTTKGLSHTTSVVDVRFSGTLSYGGEITRTQLLITMEGITDPYYKNQFGSPVQFSNGNAQYTDINRSDLVIGDYYKFTGYLDFNGNFSRDANEPTEIIGQWAFNGDKSQILNFKHLE